MITRRNKIPGRAIGALTLLLLAGAAQVNAQVPPADEADILIQNGHVVDGTGGPWMQANVAIKGNSLQLSPVSHGGSIEWRCKSTTVASRYLPTSCR